METKNQFQKTYENWSELNRKLYDDCKKYLVDILSKVPNNEVMLDGSICVEYDGGNHPEYDSNCFSCVDCVYLKDDKIYLSIEETDEYSIDNIDAQALYDVANEVEYAIQKDYDDINL